MEPETLIEAVRYFADLSVCDAYMRRIKWPRGRVVCPHCGGARIGEIASRHLLRCKDCRKQFSHKVSTIFEDSPLGLDKWFVAVWCIANARNGISSHELGRALGVTQKTAWFMLHRIRLAMETENFERFDGPAEADTTYVGGLAENMHAKRRERVITGRGAVGKTAVHAILQRTTQAGPSQIAAAPIGAETADKLLRDVRSHVRHRAIKGTYVAVAPFHVGRYVSEEAFRFNNRANQAQRPSRPRPAAGGVTKQGGGRRCHFHGRNGRNGTDFP